MESGSVLSVSTSESFESFAGASIRASNLDKCRFDFEARFLMSSSNLSQE